MRFTTVSKDGKISHIRSMKKNNTMLTLCGIWGEFADDWDYDRKVCKRCAYINNQNYARAIAQGTVEGAYA